MGFAVSYSRASIGVEAPQVTIEVHLANGIPSFALVGLAEKTVSEAKERVRSAIIQSGYEFPAKRIVVNLAPAELPKHGGRFDLAIAVAILAASEQIPAEQLIHHEFIGELSLSGTLRPVSAALPSAIAASLSGNTCIIAQQNSSEVGLCKRVKAFSATHLGEVVGYLRGGESLAKIKRHTGKIPQVFGEDISDVVGQAHAKRALLIAAAGQHNILLVGPPGTGKTLLARRLLTLLPPLSEEHALQTASIASVADQSYADIAQWFQRPFRSPHHTSSATALIGGGAIPKPGEISLAHNGVLFLDELPEFGRHILDTLREPLETQTVNISRAAAKVTYPASFQLIAAMNPSPTGDIDDARSTPDQVLRYLNRLSGPLLDRIDLQVLVNRQPLTSLNDHQSSAPQSEQLRSDVASVHSLQLDRQGVLNAKLNGAQLQQVCRLTQKDNAFFLTALEKLGASHRAMHRFLRLARTIADLDNSVSIQRQHIAEAIGYRALDVLINQLETC